MKALRNPAGVTLGNLLDSIWVTDLPWSFGLTADDGRCAGSFGEDGEVVPCKCYNMLGVWEFDVERLQAMETELKRLRQLVKAE